VITFDMAFDRLIGHEGGYVNNPNDPGGETNWGISKRSYPHLNIKDLTREDAKEIYREDFWDILGNVHSAIKFQAFDFAVNSGVQTAIRKLQLAIGVADDGIFGKKSYEKISSMDLNDVIMRFAGVRLDYMTRLKNWPDASKGWARRIAQQLLYAAEDN
jgi:lysozyme family protein